MMELRVWVDGIPRVISGATDRTTCEDVIRALAQATGRTGRFTLVEVWRGNEQKLSPSDRPLYLLQQWGEYARDVHLVLKHTSLQSSNDASPAEDSFEELPVMRRSASLKKSLTFSGPHHKNLLASSKLAHVYPIGPLGTSSLDRHRGKRTHADEDTKTRVLANSETKQKPTATATAIRSGHHSLEGNQNKVEEEKQRAIKEELINIVNMQLDRLQQQEQSMTQLQVQIVDLESRLPGDLSHNTDTQMSTHVEKSLAKLAEESLNLEQLDTELQELELVCWEDKFEREKQRSMLLNKEIFQLKLKVSDCQKDVEKVELQIKELSQEVENNLPGSKEILGQIDELRKQLDDAAAVERKNGGSLTGLEMEIKDMEINISMKKKEIAELEKELAETNLLDFPDISRSIPLRRSAQELSVLSQKSLATRALATPPRSLATPPRTMATPPLTLGTPPRSVGSPHGKLSSPRPVFFNAQTLKEAVSGDSDDNHFV